jgi:hypothetical protein
MMHAMRVLRGVVAVLLVFLVSRAGTPPPASRKIVAFSSLEWPRAQLDRVGTCA